MNAKPFVFPMRHLPCLPGVDWSGYPAPKLRFKQQGTDKGLANAVRFYWLAKRVTLTVSMSVESVAWQEVDPPTDPQTFTYDQRTFSYSKTYRQFDTDTEATSLVPAASTEEESWVLPHERGAGLTEWIPGYMAGSLGLANTFVPAADADTTGELHMDALRIEFDEAEDRWCLAISGGCGISGTDTVGDYSFGVDSTAYIEAWDYSLASSEAAGTFAYPDVFDAVHPPQITYTVPTYISPETLEAVPLTTTVSFEFAVDYWEFP